MMTANDVLTVLDLLEASSIEVWLGGGWGIDALLGEQTRPHDDVDLAISHTDAERLRGSLLGAGFNEIRADNNYNFVLGDGAGREVDVHLIDFGSTRVQEDGTAVYGPNGLAYEVGSLEGHGEILNRAVRCETAEFQMKGHTHYVPDDNDRKDVEALHRRFGIPLPALYK